MRLLTPPHQSTAGFVLFPVELFANAFYIDWERTEELYRDAYEQAQAVLRPSITNRLTPYWN
jgi:hypothetical protein